MKRAGARTSVKHDFEEIIQTCASIESRRFNPFLLDVSEALRILRRHSEQLSSLEDHLLDMKALTGVARVVGLQSAQLRFQSTSLYVDPEMAKQKLEGLSRQQLAEFFLLSWHPIVELEQLTPSTLREATHYWERMLSFFERRKRLQLGPLATPTRAGFGELAGAGLMDERGFTSRLNDIWEELREGGGSNRSVEYWAFVRTTSFAETVRRAQLVSFLVTYGYANLEKKGKSMFLVPREKPEPPREGSPISFPIPIPREMS